MIVKSWLYFVVVCITAIITLFSLLNGQPKSPDYQKIAPIFNSRCIICHNGPAAPNQLQLTSYSLIMKGSKNGKVIKPGDPANSELVKRIKGLSQPRMPLTGPPWLTDDQIGLIEAWIAAGALENKISPATSVPAPSQGTNTITTNKGSLQSEDSVMVSVPEQVTYSHVKNIFQMRCVKCHTDGGLMGNPPEELRMDSYENILSISERARVVPGKPNASELVRRIKGQAKPRMPLDGPPYLSESEIELIIKWIQQGAQDENGNRANNPVGAKIRLHGTLDSQNSLDGLPLKLTANTRFKKSPSAGDYVRVRGRLGSGGEILVERIRRR